MSRLDKLAVFLAVFYTSLLTPNLTLAAAHEAITGIRVEGAIVLSRDAPSNDGNASVGVFPGSNIRYRQVIGHRTNGQDFPAEGWFRGAWNTTMATALDRFPSAFSGHAGAVLGKSIRWRECLVDDEEFMSVAEVSDPDHPNYVWNQPGLDGLSEALSDPLVLSGTAQISLVVADTSSGARLSVPQFIIEQGLSFTSSAGDRNEVLRLDLELAREYSIAFFSAILKKWGNDPGLHSVNVSEYFAGSSSHHPPDFDLGDYYRGRASTWARIVDAAPLDSAGNRIALVQTSPVFTGGVTVEDLIEAKMGISQPDPDVFQHECGSELPESRLCENNTVSRGLQELFGVVPSFITQDDRYARTRRLTGGWPSQEALANPFEIAEGQQVVAGIEQVMWYRNNVVPADSSMFQISVPGMADGLWDEAAFLRALGRFAPGGSDAGNGQAFPPRL